MDVYNNSVRLHDNNKKVLDTLENCSHIVQCGSDIFVEYSYEREYHLYTKFYRVTSRGFQLLQTDVLLAETINCGMLNEIKNY